MMQRTTLLMLAPVLLGLTGCPKTKAPETAVTADQLSSPPRLPSPTAGTYARVPKAPKDPVIQAVIGDRTWDESLAGAAAGLALGATNDKGGFNRRELREASWQAGYAWPVLSLGSWPTSEAGGVPPGLATWLDKQAGRDVGLVRARGGGQDLWVGLAAEPLIELGIVPREVPSGSALSLPARAGARWRTSDGAGQLREGSLEKGVDIAYDVPGEWVIQIYDEGGDLARFTVYVDEEAPPTGVLPPYNVPITSRTAAQERLQELVQRARDEYRAPPMLFDPLLDQAAEDAVQKGLDLHERARNLGGSEARALAGTCRASSVEDCVDQLLWDPRTRRAFVEDHGFAGGFAMRWTPDQVTISAIFVGS